MKPLVILAGPTAVGKTELSIRLAKKINGAIISADSMQVYKYMDIGSAKVMPEEMQGVPHYLIDCLEPAESFNIVRFQQMAKAALDTIYAKAVMIDDMVNNLSRFSKLELSKLICIVHF